MSTAKVAITIERGLLTRLDRLVKSRRFPNRSRAVQEAVTFRAGHGRGRHDG
jgi:metal-responsive CopG/Arc/MetJ family transcriptional regulator